MQGSTYMSTTRRRRRRGNLIIALTASVGTVIFVALCALILLLASTSVGPQR